jgi:predicted small lipoprotein YifL
MKKNLASTFALSAAALFLGGCGKDKAPTSSPDAKSGAPTADAKTTEPDPNAKQRCYAVNECAGQTACDVAGKWDCGGNNDCCGKGWLHLTKAECDAKGGSDDEALLANPPISCPEKPADAGAAPGDAAAKG